MAFEDLKYAQRLRLQYLDQLFFWNGAATRASLIKKFEISNAQAALDFRDYLKLSKKHALVYNASSRQYLAENSFQRLSGPAQESELFELLTNFSISHVDTLPDLQRAQNVKSFLPLYRVMRSKQSVEIVYQSMKDPEPEKRRIAPQNFASDGVRLHVRAYCFARKAYRDFIPSRIDLDVSSLEMSTYETLPFDEDWFTWSILTLRPHARLSSSQKKVVRKEFGFVEDVLEIKVRKALEFYSKRRWGLGQENPRLECISVKYIRMSEE